MVYNNHFEYNSSSRIYGSLGVIETRQLYRTTDPKHPIMKNKKRKNKYQENLKEILRMVWAPTGNPPPHPSSSLYYRLRFCLPAACAITLVPAGYNVWKEVNNTKTYAKKETSSAHKATFNAYAWWWWWQEIDKVRAIHRRGEKLGGKKRPSTAASSRKENEEAHLYILHSAFHYNRHQRRQWKL